MNKNQKIDAEELKMQMEYQQDMEQINKMMQNIQQEQQQLNEKLGGDYNEIFKNLNIDINKQKQIELTQDQKDSAVQEYDIYSYSGVKILTNKEIKEKYEKGIPIIRDIFLPKCYYNICQKLRIFMVVSGALGLSLFYIRKSNYQYQGIKVFTNNKKSVYLHMLGSIVGVSLLTIAESLFNDQFCNINSNIYEGQHKTNRLKNIVHQYK